MTEAKPRWIQGGTEGGRGGHEVRARLRKWAETCAKVPVRYFDHTRIYRLDGHTIIETEPYTDLSQYELERVFSGFNTHGWSVRVEASERGETCNLITLTSPKDWVLPNASELGLKRSNGGRHNRLAVGDMVSYFLP